MSLTPSGECMLTPRISQWMNLGIYDKFWRLIGHGKRKTFELDFDKKQKFNPSFFFNRCYIS